MTDWKALCAELTHEVEQYADDRGDLMPECADRARAALAAEPVAERPTDTQLIEEAIAVGLAFQPQDEVSEVFLPFDAEDPLDELLVNFARAVLARFGHHSPDATKMVGPAEGEVGDPPSELVHRWEVDGQHHTYETPLSIHIATQAARWGAAQVVHRSAVPVADGPAVPEGREPASVVGEPTDEELALIYHDCCRGCEFMDQGGFEDAARAVLARWGRPAPVPAEGELAELVAWLRGANWDGKRQTLATRAADLLERQAAPAPDDRGVLPMIVSETGADDEPELERIICASISGGADYVNNMPRELSLERITPEGSTFARYIQADADTHLDVRPAPAPAGDVADAARYLAKELRDQADDLSPSLELFGLIHRAADLLEQRHPVPVPVSERLPGDELCWWFEADEDCGYGSNWTLLRVRGCASGYTHWLPATALPLPEGEVEP